jgi:hypothetical protein
MSTSTTFGRRRSTSASKKASLARGMTEKEASGFVSCAASASRRASLESASRIFMVVSNP